MAIKEVLNNFLFKLSRNTLKRNESLKEGLDDSCYIIGTGSSIRNLDLSKFNDHPVILINWAFIHTGTKNLNIDALVLPEPFILSPLIRKHWKRSPTVNRKRKAVLAYLSKIPINIPILISLTNILFFRRKNIYFAYHFDSRNCDIKKLDIASRYSFMAGGLYSAIGLALNKGYENLKLIGCDYLIKSSKIKIPTGHFYTKSDFVQMRKYKFIKNPYEDLFAQLKKTNVNISLISGYPDKDVSVFCEKEPYENYRDKLLPNLVNRKSIVDKEFADFLADVHLLHE